MTTLRQLVVRHPEWLDLELTVGRSDGGLDFIDAAGSVYVTQYNDDDDVDMDEDLPRHPDTIDVLVFEAN